jgi:hypothetical protein
VAACTKIPVKFSLEQSKKRPPDWREELLLPPPVEVPEIHINPPPPPPQPIPLAPSPPDRSVPL